MLIGDDLRALIAPPADPAVSLFMTTHVVGREVAQDPIRLRKLLDDAATELVRRGQRRTVAENLVAPATALTRDEHFWRHRGRGLALFLSMGALRWWHVPIELGELVNIGNRHYIKPLLPLVNLEGATFTAAAERLEHDLGEANGRATATATEAVTAAHDGRVDTLFLREGAVLWGRFDLSLDRTLPHTHPADGDDDLLDWAAAETLLKNGHVSVVREGALPRLRDAAALLRY